MSMFAGSMFTNMALCNAEVAKEERAIEIRIDRRHDVAPGLFAHANDGVVRASVYIDDYMMEALPIKLRWLVSEIEAKRGFPCKHDPVPDTLMKWGVLPCSSVRMEEEKVVAIPEEAFDKMEEVCDVPEPKKDWFDDVKKRNAKKSERLASDDKWKKRLGKYENK